MFMGISGRITLRSEDGLEQGVSGFGVAFEGCSCRAAFHVGVMERLREDRFVPSAVSGASSGAMIAAGVALDRIEAMRDHWRRLAGVSIFHPRRLARGRWPFVMSHLLADVLRDQLGTVTMSQLPMPTAIVVTQLRRRGLCSRVLTRADAIAVEQAVRASCFLPGVYSRMVPVDRRPTFDGAWLQRVPVDEVLALGVSRAIAVVTEPEVGLRTGWPRVRNRPLPAGVKLIAPEAPLALRGFDFDRQRTEACFAAGQEAASRFVEKHHDWLSGA
jgi:NTE family protein